MQQDPQETVMTGLAPQPPSEPTPPAPVSEPIKLNIPDDVTTRYDEVNQPAVVAAQVQPKPPEPPAQHFTKDLQDQAEADNLKRDFISGVMAARAPAPAPYVPPPVSERVAEQTRLEIEAGRKTLAVHSERQAVRPRHVPDPREGTTKSVLRPE